MSGMRLGGAARLVVAVSALVACGGRTMVTNEDGEGGTSNKSPTTGGPGKGVPSSAGNGPNTSSGTGGSPSASGPSAPGGAPVPTTGGTLGMGASSSAGAAVMCGPCRSPVCPAGYVPVPPEPGVCCSSGCQLDCSNVFCSDIDLDCGPGFHVGTLPDECCAQCLRDDPIPCEVAKAQYQMLRSERIAKYQALGCDPRGCFLFQERNRCSSSCGTPIPRDARDLIEEDLANWAWDNCTECPQPDEQPCLEPPASGCVANQCQYLP
jgi:hypothetical protein